MDSLPLARKLDKDMRAATLCRWPGGKESRRRKSGEPRHCERPAFARCASYGGFGVRRSAEREGGSEAIQGMRARRLRPLDCFVAATRRLAMTPLHIRIIRAAAA